MQIEKSGCPEQYVGRQPILDAGGRLVAYELLFRNSSQNDARITDGVISTMAVIGASLGELGLGDVLNGKDCFLNCPDEFFYSPALKLLPPERFVLEVMETSALGPELHCVCNRLREEGFRIALDDVTAYTPDVERMLSAVDIVKVDWKYTVPSERAALCRVFKQAGVLVLAEKVEDWQDFHLALDAGASLFQGYYFSRPEVLSSKAIPPTVGAVLEIMQMLLEDAPYRHVAAALLRIPALLAQLLRLAASGATPSRRTSRFESVDDALLLVGNDRLMQWCALLLYLSHLPDGDDPLAHMATQRAIIMERYIVFHHPKNPRLQRRAHLAGALSLLHVAYQCEAEMFWRGLWLDQEIRDAVLAERGPIGDALMFVRRCEHGDLSHYASPVQAEL